MGIGMGGNRDYLVAVTWTSTESMDSRLPARDTPDTAGKADDLCWSVSKYLYAWLKYHGRGYL